MNFKTTILGAATAIAISASGAFAATTLVYGTDVVGTPFPDGSLDLSFSGFLGSDDYDIDTAFNLQAYTEIQLDPDVFGTGSLTVSTYVDPFIAAGTGSANVLLSVGETLPAGSVTVQWGTGPTYDISDGLPTNISTAFTSAGLAGAKDLVFTWASLTTVEQLSANVAAVPVPAGLLLLGTALGGLGLTRRRRKKADA